MSSMKRAEIALKVLHVGRHNYKLQFVFAEKSRSGAVMRKTVNPHFDLMTPTEAVSLGYDVDRLILKYITDRLWSHAPVPNLP